jgi:hypothetical protein
MRQAECHGDRESIVGDLTVGYEVFSPAGDKDQVVTLHTAEPGSPPERICTAGPLGRPRRLPAPPEHHRRA